MQLHLLLGLQSLEYDPTYNSSFRPGVPVRVRLNKSTVDEIIWSGVIDSIDTTFDQDGNNIMRLTAFDSFKRLMNTRIESFDSTTGFPGYVTPYEQLELVATAFKYTRNKDLLFGRAGYIGKYDGYKDNANSYLEAFSAPRILIINCSRLSNDAALLKYATQAVIVYALLLLSINRFD